MTSSRSRAVGESFYGYGLTLRPVTLGDLPALRRWRNNPKISRMMTDHSYIGAHQQRKWFEGFYDKVDQGHWVVWRNGIRTGYMKIQGIVEDKPLDQQEETDVGTYVGDSTVRYGLLGYAVALMQLQIVFEYLSISGIRTEIREWNVRGRKFNHLLGYREGDKKGGLIVMTIDQESFIAAKRKISRYFNDPSIQVIK